jgi:SNF2 family DNA or RNA helicase
MGQDKPATLVRLLADGIIEERMLALHGRSAASSTA